MISKKNKLNQIIILLLIITFFPAMSSCTPKAEPVTDAAFFFDTYITITYYSNEDLSHKEEVRALCAKYENMLSRTVEGSDIYNINHALGKGVTVSDETIYLLNEAIKYCELTDGHVDITVAPLMDLWDFTGDKPEKTPPSDEEIQALLKHVDYRNIEINGNEVTLKDPEAEIDLGFIAKGFIADKLKEMLLSKGVTSALINLGGNVQLIGSKPDGGDYIIGVKRPFSNGDDALTTLSIHDTSMATSGVYERCFDYNGTLYHHILDAKTGYPVQNDLYQVSVLCPDSCTADALSTTLFVLGQEKGMELLSRNEFDAHAIYVDSNYQMTYSPDFPE